MRHLNKFRCPGTHQHQQIAGRIAITSTRTAAASQFASAYCRGFARVLASLILGEDVYAAGEEVPPRRTRKRFKAPDGSARSSPWVRPAVRAKREATDNPDGHARGNPVRGFRPASDKPDPENLDPTIWAPWFENASEYSPGRGTHLISPEDELISQLSSRLPEYDVVQAFLKFKTRTMCSPVGALPTMVAPLRISLARLSGPRFVCFGREQRNELTAAQIHDKLPPCELMITVMRRPRVTNRVVSQPATIPAASGAEPPVMAGAEPTY